MLERERRKWLRFDVHQEGVSDCSLLDRKGGALPMLIRDIGMGGLCLVRPRGAEPARAAVSGAVFTLSSPRVHRFGRRIDGRRVRVVWTRPGLCGCRFDMPLFGQPTGLRRLLSLLKNLIRSDEPSSLLGRLAARLDRRQAAAHGPKR